MTTTTKMTKATTPGTVITPGGAKITNAPPGLLEFLVGIQANESGWDYYRAQGSPGGSVEPASDSVGGGYGAYQFQQGTDQFQQASAAAWDPKTQDEIAASMAEGYLKEFTPLAEKAGVNPWEYVAEAWYGPGTVPQEPIAANSVPDVQNVLNAEGGHAALPSAWVYGPGHSGLSVAQVKSELGGDTTPAQLDAWYNHIPVVGSVASAASTVASLGSDLAPSNLKTLAITGSAVIAGLGIIALGVFIFAKEPAERAAQGAGKVAAVAAL